MRVIALADVHIGRRHTHTFPHIDRPKVTCRILYDCVALCKVHGATHIIISGDLLDKAHPDLEVLLGLYWALVYAKSEGIAVWWIRGNHEIELASRLNNNVMFLYEAVCNIVVEPRSFTTNTTVLMFIPWYPDAKLMKRLFEEAAAMVHGDKREKILFSHLALNEGRMSPSNFMAPQPVSVKDLHPKQWDSIWLGDYHMHQQLAGNVWYMGAPIPHTFGDTDIEGVWLIDTEAGEYESIPLDGYPQFHRWYHHGTGIPTFPIRDTDYNEIYVPPGIADTVKALYPLSDVKHYETPEERDTVELSGVRLEREKLKTVHGMVEAWLTYCGVRDTLLYNDGIALLTGGRG